MDSCIFIMCSKAKHVRVNETRTDRPGALETGKMAMH